MTSALDRHHPSHDDARAGGRTSATKVRRAAASTRDEVYIADEAFFTGTAAEVTPIREVDNRAEIGNGSRGPVTGKLQKALLDLVAGRNPKYEHWLTSV